MDVGMWIWRFGHAEGGDVGQVQQQAVDVGLGHVTLKIADGTSAVNGDNLAPVFDQFSTGMNVFAWAYTYGKDPEGEAELFGQRALALTTAGLIVDAEGDSYANSPARAQRYMNRLRQIVGNAPIALSSHRFPSLHPDVPIATFMEACDVGMPQAYFLQPPVEQNLARVLQEWQGFGKPVAVTGAAYHTAEGDAVGPPENIGRLLRLCDQAGIEQVNFWEWSFVSPAIWDQIQAFTTA